MDLPRYKTNNITQPKLKALGAKLVIQYVCSVFDLLQNEIVVLRDARIYPSPLLRHSSRSPFLVNLKAIVNIWILQNQSARDMNFKETVVGYLKEWDILEIFFANFFAHGLGYECCHALLIRMV